MIANNYLSKSLSRLNIYTIEDYQQYVQKWRTEAGQKNVNVLRNIVQEYYYGIVKTTNNEDGQFISINSDEVFMDDSLDNYMCFFPKRTLIETETLMTFQHGLFSEEKFNKPPDHFFEIYFGVDRLINKGIAYLYPISTGGTANSYANSNIIKKHGNVAQVYTSKNFETVKHKKDMFYLAFPWLYNANTEDFIEICDNYPAAFDFFAHSISKIAMASNGEVLNLNDSVFKDVEDALKEIQSAFEKRKVYLKRKGINTVMGIALTFVPYAISEIFDNFNPELFSAFLGGSTIHSGHELITDFFDNSFTDNPYWVIWKWKQKNNQCRIF